MKRPMPAKIFEGKVANAKDSARQPRKKLRMYWVTRILFVCAKRAVKMC